MGEKIKIYNTEIELPEQPAVEEIEDWGEIPENQYWRRKSLPKIFKTINRDDDGNIDLTTEQEEYCSRELDRIKNGFWFLVKGVPTYITGRNYYYLQYWTLENRKAPEYRDTSRRYFIFLDHWYNVYWCLGILRGKGRRSGASSESSSNTVSHVTTTKNARGGHVSKTSADARKMFIFRMQFGFRHLPFFLQPTLANDKDSKSELVFNVPLAKTKKTKKAQLIDEVEGLNSILDYQPTATNSYDSERLTWAFIDEGGKWPADVPFDQFLSIVLETLVEGSERVGFAEFPSTVNEMTKKGGAAFKRAWDNADWVIDEDSDDSEEDDEFDTETEATANRLVRYFCPAYDGLAGFIGKYGESIIETPTPEQSEYLISRFGEKKYKGQLKHGAKKYLEKRRSKLRGGDLEEEMRKYPFNETEMFMAANSDCVFDQININNQRKYVRENNPPLRKVIYYRKEDQTVGWRDAKDATLYWDTLAFPPEGEENKFIYDGRMRQPGRKEDGCIGVDGYSNSQGGKKYGSKACGMIYRKYNIANPHNTGMFCAMIYGRPQYKEQLHEQILLAAEYYGYQVYYEHVADDYDGYFRQRGRQGYLGVYPLNAIDPIKRDKAERHRGFPTTPFALTKSLDIMIAYVATDANTGTTYCSKIYFDKLLEQMLVFDPYDRNKSDCVVSAMIALVSSMELANRPPPRRKPLVRVWKNPNYKEKIV